MRIFKDFVEADKEIKREIMHNGLVYQSESYQDKKVADDDGFLTKELLGYTFLVKDPDIDAYADYRLLDKDWIEKDFAERVSGTKMNPGEAWKIRRQMWEPFLETDGKFSYSYPERIGDQPKQVIELLKIHPTSRHGFINIYMPDIDNERRDGSRRVPCSMWYMAMIRDGKLVLFYNIRSNDYNGHFGYDLVMARKMQEYIAREVGVPVGDFIYQSGSLHAFKKDNAEIF
jgi:thymidylate synthase